MGEKHTNPNHAKPVARRSLIEDSDLYPLEMLAMNTLHTLLFLKRLVPAGDAGRDRVHGPGRR